MYRILIDDLESIKAMVGHEAIGEATTKISERIGSLGKHVKSVYSEPNEIIAFAEEEPDADSIFKKHLFRLVKEIYFEVADAEIDFSYGHVHFPAQGQMADMLWKEISGQKVSETRERMGKTILVVDDIVELTEQVQILLEHFGYQHIDIVHNGQAVFDYMQRKMPDLVILDMKMPGMSGYEVIGRLKESHKTKDLPILIMSGYEVEIGRLHDSISQRAILTINKPVQPELLRKMVYFLL
jgi:CheY-like chemotaxis protein